MKLIFLSIRNNVVSIKEEELPVLPTFNHFFDFLEMQKPELYGLFCRKRLSIVLQKNESEKPFAWRPEINFENFWQYEKVYVLENLEGQAVFSSIASAIAAAIVAVGTAGATAAATAAFIAAWGTAIAITANVLAAVIMLGIAYGIGEIMKALSPSREAESSGRSLIFSDMTNVNTQGGVIPWVIGEALCTGVIVGRRITTHDIIIGDSPDVPELPASIPEIHKASINSAVESRWYKLIS